MTDTISEWVGEVHEGHAPDVLYEMPTNSVHMAMFSPPYWAIRHYSDNGDSVWGGDKDCDHTWKQHPKSPETEDVDHDLAASGSGVGGELCEKCNAWRGQFGLEPTYDLYIKNIVRLARAVRHVLRDDGGLWLNVGDIYSSRGLGWQTNDKKAATGKSDRPTYQPNRGEHIDIPNKCKILLPHRIAIALVNDGWVIRNDAIWEKVNPVPESVQDRLSTGFEFLFYLTPSDDHYFDPTISSAQDHDTSDIIPVKTASYDDDHDAVYDEDLCTVPLETTCPETVCADCGTPYTPDGGNYTKACGCDTTETRSGIALDPTCGRGTTCRAAADLDRRHIGIDVNPEYVEMANDYIPETRQKDLDSFL